MKRLILTTGFLALAALAACSAKDDDADTSQKDTEKGLEPYEPAGNGVHTSEAEACQRMIQALDQRASELGCVITYPSCPHYLRQSTNGACYEYDEGTIDSCVDFISKYPACEDFKRRPCVVAYFPESSCDEGDAGTDADAGDDAATESDAADEAEN